MPEDYVHRIGRTGRAGSTGAAISLVDEEETKFLKDIEKLIKREIPKVKVEGFVPPLKQEPEPPRLFRGQQPNRGQGNGQRQGQGRNKPAGNTQGQKPQGQNRNQNQPKKPASAYGHGRLIEPAPQGNKGNNQNISEAARHQARPQPPLFNPKPQTHRSGGRGR